MGTEELAGSATETGPTEEDQGKQLIGSNPGAIQQGMVGYEDLRLPFTWKFPPQVPSHCLGPSPPFHLR